MRKLLATLLAGLCLTLGLPAAAQEEKERPQLPDKPAILMDATTGQVLYEQHADDRHYPASTTKLLTALVAVENANLDDVVTVSGHAAAVEGTTCWLRAGERQPLADLLRCMLVHSGNDAAVAVAEHVAGTEAAFAELMTARARALGAVNSHFTNASGLHHPEHYTTARDLATIARAALAHPTVREYASSRKAVLGGVEQREYYNTNRLLFTFDWAVAGKTGFTSQGRHTLVAYGEQGGIRLIGVLLNFEDREAMFREMAELMTWGFNRFTRRPVVTRGEPFGNVAVDRGEAATVAAVAAQEFMVLVPVTGSMPDVSREVVLPEVLAAPVRAGERLGQVIVRLDGRELGRVDLVAAAEVREYQPLWQRAAAAIGTAPERILGGAAVAALGLMALRLVAVRRRYRRSRRGRITSLYRGGRLP